LFTFLSANGASTLPAFLDKYEDDDFEVITPDCIYDYFEPLLRKEVYSGDLHTVYQLTSVILSKLEENSLESKIVKTISLIYILEQFEKLKPTKDELVGIYSVSYTVPEIEQAIANLIDKEYVVYLKRSNNYLRLKQTSGIDIHKTIQDMVASLSGKISVKTTLNESNFDNYVYPSRYNDEREMTRYFAFEFIDEDEIGLTGLKATLAALDHLSPTRTSSVMGKLTLEYRGDSDGKMQQLTKRIGELQDELERITVRLSELDDEIESATTSRAQFEQDIKQFADGEKLQNERERLRRELADVKRTKATFGFGS